MCPTCNTPVFPGNATLGHVEGSPRECELIHEVCPEPYQLELKFQRPPDPGELPQGDPGDEDGI